MTAEPDERQSRGGREQLVFVTLTFSITWSFWLPITLATRDAFDLGAAEPVFWFAGGLGPTLAAVVVVYLRGRWPAIRELLRRLLIWRVGASWYVIAVLLPLALVMAAFGLHRAFDGLEPDGTNLDLWYLFILALLVSIPFGPLSEEFGWRGYWLPALQRRQGPVIASLVIGVVWGAWHLPLFFMRDVPQADTPFLLFVLHGIALSILFTWVFNNARGSVLMMVLLHASINTSFWLIPTPATRDFGLQLYLIHIALTWLLALALVARGSLRPAEIDRRARV
jgi:uncharacterized protein